MNISVIGLGYVGSVCVGCYSNLGFNLYGVDISQSKVKMINSGKSPVIEPKLDELISSGLKNGSIKASTDINESINESELCIICVGTPNDSETGLLNLSYVFKVVNDICENFPDKKSNLTISIRSTVSPGTVKKCKQIIENYNLSSKIDVIINPEFLREGSGVFDFYNPSQTIVGIDDSTFKSSIELMKKLNRKIDKNLIFVPSEVAEVIKYVNNSWHAVKVAFANEVGSILNEYNIDSSKVFSVFNEEKKLNISKAYLSPGFSYGGSCLPKDLKGLYKLGLVKNLKTSLLLGTEKSNFFIIEKLFNYLNNIKPNKKILIVGLAFKPDTDDIRNSPSLILAEKLIGAGKDLHIYDPAINISNLLGKNLSQLMENLPHISQILEDENSVKTHKYDTVILAHNSKNYIKILKSLKFDFLYELGKKSNELDFLKTKIIRIT